MSESAFEKVLFVGGPFHGQMKDAIGTLPETLKMLEYGPSISNAVYVLKTLENRGMKPKGFAGEKIYMFEGFEFLNPA